MQCRYQFRFVYKNKGEILFIYWKSKNVFIQVWPSVLFFFVVVIVRDRPGTQVDEWVFALMIVAIILPFRILVDCSLSLSVCLAFHKSSRVRMNVWLLSKAWNSVHLISIDLLFDQSDNHRPNEMDEKSLFDFHHFFSFSRLSS